MDVGSLAGLIRQRARNLFGRAPEEPLYLEHLGVDNVDILGVFQGRFLQKLLLSFGCISLDMVLLLLSLQELLSQIDSI